jgi:hypothetical protein
MACREAVEKGLRQHRRVQLSLQAVLEKPDSKSTDPAFGNAPPANLHGPFAD